MATEHWFDALNKLLVSGTSRRVVPLAASMLAARTLLDVTAPAEAGKNKQKHKKRHKNKGKNKDKGKKDQKKDEPWGCEDRFQNLRIKDPNCSEGDCTASYPDDPCEEKYCEFICNQCDEGDPREFCIVEGDALNPAKTAVCCPDSGECCGNECCGSYVDYRCCDGACRHTKSNANHCGGCGIRCGDNEVCTEGSCEDRCPTGSTSCPYDQSGCCQPDQNGFEFACCEDGCKVIRTPHYGGDRDNCGGCGVVCLEGQTCLEGGVCGCHPDLAYCAPYCTDLDSDPYNCGSCGNVCDFGKGCHDGVCRCEEGFQYCEIGQKCAPDFWTCCGHWGVYAACHPTLPCCGTGDDAYCGQFGYCP